MFFPTTIAFADDLNTTNRLNTRYRAVLAAINIVRWISTAASWLPDTAPPCRMLQWSPRHDLPGMYNNVELWLGFNHVRKKYQAPRRRAEQLLYVQRPRGLPKASRF